MISAIQERWSPRAFSDQPVLFSELEPLFAAAGRAPSAMNEQPWRFVAATKAEHPEQWDALLKSLVEGNQAWAKSAPALVAVLAKNTYSSNGQPNPTAQYDTGQAVAHFILQAKEEGLYTHQIGGFHADKAASSIGLPQGYDLIAFIAVGHLGNPDQLPEPLKERELNRTPRKSNEEFVSLGVCSSDWQ